MTYSQKKLRHDLQMLQLMGFQDRDFEKALLMTPEKIEHFLAAEYPLSLGEVDRVLQLLHLVRRLEKNMSEARVLSWLRSPREELDGRSPLEMIGPEAEKLLSLEEESDFYSSTK